MYDLWRGRRDARRPAPGGEWELQGEKELRGRRRGDGARLSRKSPGEVMEVLCWCGAKGRQRVLVGERLAALGLGGGLVVLLAGKLVQQG
jgi:hypothetical protein